MYTDKMMIVMRRDLKMRKGKIAAQAGHAAVEATLMALTKSDLLSRIRYTDNGMTLNLSESEAEAFPIARWFLNGEAKICVYVDSEEALLQIAERCHEADLLVALIQDAGMTEFHGEPTLTCLAIEPRPADVLQPITGDLPLY